jgi:hypothetical protein
VTHFSPIVHAKYIGMRACSILAFMFLCILFVYLEACLRFHWVVGLGFLCMLEARSCVLRRFALFLVYNTLTYQKKKKKILAFFFFFFNLWNHYILNCLCFIFRLVKLRKRI